MQVIDVQEAVNFDPVRPCSKTLLDTPQAKVLLFCLEAGQEVPTHGTDSEVIFYTVSGEGMATIGEEEVALRPGLLVRCPAREPHGLKGSGSLVVLATVAPRP
ncbi:MAG: cupin domain-containing protein [Chloroflexota bacterium]